VSARLSPIERLERETTEAAFQAQVTSLAELLGWAWVHFRPGRTQHGWRTPVEGPLGAGWPDLVLLRVRDRRLIFAELKRELEQVSADQAAVLAALGQLAANRYSFSDGLGFRVLALPQVEAYIWRPSDLRDPIQDSAIGRVLR
jgi:hypothetical protein